MLLLSLFGDSAWAYVPSAFACGSDHEEHPISVGLHCGMLEGSVSCSKLLSFLLVVQLHVLPSCN